MKAISFLGASPYETVTYFWKEGDRERTCTTHLFPEAIARIFGPEKIFLLVTEKARAYAPPRGEELRGRKTYLEELKERLGERIEAVTIPDGKSEEELWQIFDICADLVEQGEDLLLDITHAFRSLPMIVFAVAAYLRSTRAVKVRHILYGAYDARQDGTPPRAPIFDLTPLLELLDWLRAVDAFVRSADASLLGQKLREAHQRPWRRGLRGDLPQRLQDLGDGLKQLSLALHFARPVEIMETAHALLPKFQKARREVAAWAKPFAVVFEWTEEELRRLAYGNPRPHQLSAEYLQKQREIIEYFVSKGLYTQAILLAREWIVNWALFKRGEPDWLNVKSREQVTDALGELHKQLRQRKVEASEQEGQLPDHPMLAKIWSEIVHLRNDLAHCGMRQSATRLGRLKEKASQIPKALGKLLNAPSADAPENEA